MKVVCGINAEKREAMQSQILVACCFHHLYWAMVSSGDAAIAVI
jgi:hypothetical protein